jgi:uncharacterized coiled-coil DUF342 family protein
MIQSDMKEQALNQEFYQYYNRLTKVQKESMLTMVKSFLDKSEDKAQRISVEQYNKELEEAEKRISKGEYITHESLKAEAKKW